MPEVENFTLLFEKDLRPVLVKIGYPPEFAEWAHALNKKYSPFIARAAFGKPTDAWKEDPENPEDHKKVISHTLGRVEPLKERLVGIIQALFQEQNKPKLPVGPNEMDLQTANALVQQLQYMKDWWNNPAVEGVNPRTLKWEEAYQAATEWHEEQAQKAGGTITTKEGQEVIHQFEDGSYWVDLNTDYCRDEADAMGHCGSASEGTLFSLRDRKGEPCITADINKEEKISGQVFGRANTKPKPEYHRKILTLFGILGITKLKTLSHGGDSSLSLGDIDEEDKEWFEEEYGYEIEQDGCTEADIDEAEEIMNKVNEDLNFISVWCDFSSGEEWISADWSLYLDLEALGFEFNENALAHHTGSYKYTSIKRDYTSGWKNPLQDVLPQIDYDEWDDGTTYRPGGSLGSFNIEQGLGDEHGSGTRFDRVQDWARGICDGLDYYDDEIAKAFPKFVASLVDAGIIYDDEFSSLFYDIGEDSNTKIVATRGDNFNVTSTIPCSELTAAISKRFNLNVDLSYVGSYGWDRSASAKGLKRYQEKVKNALNKKKTLEALMFQSKGYSMEQLEFEFMDSLGESQNPNWIDSGHLYVTSINSDSISVAMTFDPSDEDQKVEAMRKISYLTNSGEELGRAILAILGWYGRGGERSAGAYVKRRSAQVENFMNMMG